jgi:ATP-dependent RNA helicase DHX57
MKLHLVLPPGPRDYWNELAAEHRTAPAHLHWLYAADPFGAKKEVDERKAKSKDAPTTSGPRKNDATIRVNDIPEVKMATNIREAVEEIIKKVAID